MTTDVMVVSVLHTDWLEYDQCQRESVLNNCVSHYLTSFIYRMILKTIYQGCLQDDLFAQTSNTFNLILYKSPQVLLSLQQVKLFEGLADDVVYLGGSRCFFQLLHVLLTHFYNLLLEI